MTTLLLSGWAQGFHPFKELSIDATYVEYLGFKNTDLFFDSLHGIRCDTVIGWSLGGQLALRAISKGILAPRQLVLISTPFQFIDSHPMGGGMPAATYHHFKHRFTRHPKKSLHYFCQLIAKNEQASKTITKKLKKHLVTSEHLLYWLEVLEHFSCQSLDFENIPKTLIIHGRDDAIVDASQTALFKPLISQCRVEILPHCGHAPHLHDAYHVQHIIDKNLCP